MSSYPSSFSDRVPFFLVLISTCSCIPGRKGESVFYDNIFRLVLRVCGLSSYLFIGQNRGQNFVHRLGVKWHLSFSRAVSHRIELARMYICRQYRGYVRSPTRQELREPNHPKDVNGSRHGISIDLLLVQPIRS